MEIYNPKYIAETLEIIRKHKEKIGALNSMCAGCLEHGKSCNGTTCQTWTGCIYRRTK